MKKLLPFLLLLASCQKRSEPLVSHSAHAWPDWKTSARETDNHATISPAQAEAQRLAFVNANPGALHSATVDADSLRDYLLNPAIKRFRIVMAYRDGETGSNRPADALNTTFILVGEDSAGNSVKNRLNGYADNLKGFCPDICPVSGESLNQ